MGKVKKIAENVVKAPVNLVKSVAKGDVKGAGDALSGLFSYGTVGIEKGGLINASDITGKKVTGGATSSVLESETKATTELKQEADNTAKRRVALFETAGDELGEEVFSVGKKKRGAILGN